MKFSLVIIALLGCSQAWGQTHSSDFSYWTAGSFVGIDPDPNSVGFTTSHTSFDSAFSGPYYSSNFGDPNATDGLVLQWDQVNLDTLTTTTFSWTSPVTNLRLQLGGLDAAGTTGDTVGNFSISPDSVILGGAGGITWDGSTLTGGGNGGGWDSNMATLTFAGPINTLSMDSNLAGVGIGIAALSYDIPEPSSALLFSLGLLALGRRCRG